MEEGEVLPILDKREEPRTFPIKVPRGAGVCEDFRRFGTTYIGEVGELLRLEEGQESVILRWSRRERRKYDGRNWDPIVFKETILRDGKEVEIERFGWIGSKPRSKKKQKEGKPIVFVGSGGVLIPGPVPEKRKRKQPSEQYPMPGFEK